MSSVDYCVVLPIADIPDPLLDSQIVAINDDGTLIAYLATSLIDPLASWPVTAAIWAAWDREQVKGDGYLQFGETYDIDGITVLGTPNFPIDPEYWVWVNSLGNDAGEATGPLQVVAWQGAPVEKNAVTDVSQYPASNAPFTLEIIRQDYGSDALPWDNGTTYNTGDFATSGGMWQSLQDGNVGNTPFGGSAFWEFINQSGPWGWVVKMLSDDPGRDITARAIGVYSDPAATAFLYTTGAFINDGKYGDVFYTECPPGNRLTNPDPVYYALLLGAGQEGIFQLESLVDGAEATALFWSANAP